MLELFHGPTSAFKDVGARFLANCMEVLAHESAHASRQKSSVIVATSGDTGGAVAAAFHQKSGIDVVILFPKGRISARQEAQLCAWGDNIRAFAVEGTFDDCQRIVKETLLAPSADRQWLSANSINLGRILPQMIYYAYASLLLHRRNSENALPEFVIPSGNLGNSLAALWCKKMGLPIGSIVLALNANQSVIEFMKTGAFKPSDTIATLANAMDVGNPSNLERMRSLYPSMEELRSHVVADAVSDSEIQNAIRTSEAEWKQVLCPHSATGAVVSKRRRRSAPDQDRVLVATAHPAKFESIVEPLIGHEIEIPSVLREILKRPSHFQTIQPTHAELMRKIK